MIGKKNSPTRHSGDIGSPEWKGLISTGAGVLGIQTSARQLELIARYGEVLSQWNRRFNLTAIKKPEEVAVKHFLDAMAALPFLPESGRLLDIGSGGGFPGLVLSIFRPSLRITSIDSVRKKISFQQHVIRSLNLAGARAIHTRAEALTEIDGGSHKNRYDIIVCRAFGSVKRFLDLALPLLAEKGMLIAYKGVVEEDAGGEIEILSSRHPDLSVDIHRYPLPLSGDRRCLMFIRRK